jgi:hypothetical protein
MNEMKAAVAFFVLLFFLSQACGGPLKGVKLRPADVSTHQPASNADGGGTFVTKLLVLENAQS